MISRRQTLQLTAAAGLAAALPLAAQAAGKLTLQSFPTDENGFFRMPVLVSGEKDAILIDGPFNYGDGMKIVDAIKKSGKNLKMIIQTIYDPDFYFGMKPIHEAFPGTPVVSAPLTIKKMHDSIKGKLATWSPVLKQYGPATEADIVWPTAWKSPNFMLEGKTIQVIDNPGLGDRGRFVWIPSLKAVLGGSLVFSGLHLWTADNAKPALKTAWIRALDNITAHSPKIVIPGHQFAAGDPQGVEVVKLNKRYLKDFIREQASAKDGATLIAAMTKLYPQLQKADPFLVYGAKVAKGEMKWG